MLANCHWAPCHAYVKYILGAQLREVRTNGRRVREKQLPIQATHEVSATAQHTAAPGTHASSLSMWRSHCKPFSRAMTSCAPHRERGIMHARMLPATGAHRSLAVQRLPRRDFVPHKSAKLAP